MVVVSFIKRHSVAFSLVVILLFSLLAGIKLFDSGFFTSHDGEGHVIRMIEFHESISDGQFPVRFAKRLYYGLNYPFYHFNYPGVYYVGEMLHNLGLSFVNTFKLLLFIAILAGSVGAYFYSRLFFSSLGALVSAIVYMFAPYKFLNIYVRGNVAESIGLALLPFLFLTIELLLQRKKYATYYCILIISLLILFHNITAYIGLTLGVIYFLLRLIFSNYKYHVIHSFIIAIMAALLLTSFFWYPALTQSPATKLMDLSGDYKKFFPTIAEILYSPWGFGAYVQGIFPGKMSPQIGLTQIILYIFSIFLILQVIIKKRVSNTIKIVIFFLVIATAAFLLATNLSLPLWDLLLPLKIVQLPFRFIGYAVFAIAILSAFSVDYFPWKRFKILFVLLIFISLFYANRNHIRVNQNVVFNNPFLVSSVYQQSTTSNDEHLPKNAKRISNTPNANGELLLGDGTSKRTVWKTNEHVFQVNAKNNDMFIDNTFYFPGWSVMVDRKPAALKTHEEKLAVSISLGKHEVKFFYKEPFTWLLVDAISLLTFITIIVFLTRSLFVAFVGYNLAISLLSFYFFPSRMDFPYSDMIDKFGLPHFIASFGNFDGMHYVRIASFGYVNFEQVFFPLYPFLIFILKPALFNNVLTTGIIISYVTFWLGLRYFQKYLLLLGLYKKQVFWILIFLLFFPSSFFFLGVYTESLFFLLVILALFFLQKKNYIFCAIFSILASLCRLQGVLLFIPIALIFLWDFAHLQKRYTYLLLLFSPFVGLMLYGSYLFYAFGDPLLFYHAQEQFGANRISSGIILLPQVLYRYGNIILQTNFSYTYFVAVVELLLFLFAFIVICIDLVKRVWKKHSFSRDSISMIGLNLFSLANILVPTLTGTLSSIPRYILVSFTFFIIIGSLKTAIIKWFLFSIFLLLHSILLTLFIRGYFVA